MVDVGVFKEYCIHICMDITEGFVKLKHTSQNVDHESLVGLAQITTMILQIKCWEGGQRTALRTAIKVSATAAATHHGTEASGLGIEDIWTHLCTATS